MSGKAFEDSSKCGGLSFSDWLWALFIYFLALIVFPGLLYIFLVYYTPIVVFLPILFFLVKCWSQVAAGVRAYWKGVSEPWRLILVVTPLGWIVLTWVFVKHAWCVPIAAIPRLARSDAVKVCYRLQP